MKMTPIRFLLVALIVFSAACRSTPHQHGQVLPSPFSPNAVHPANAVVDTAESLQTNDPSQFTVKFQGIICHIMHRDRMHPENDAPVRAILLESTLGNLHKSVLKFQRKSDIDFGALRDLTREPLICDDVFCGVVISGTDLRIRGKNDSLPNKRATASGFEFDKSFDCLVKSVTAELDPAHSGENPKGALTGAVLAADPSSPANDVFEYEGGGWLAACQLAKLGIFDGDSKSACTKFADVVEWEGSADTVANLEIRSAATGNRWRTVPRSNTGKLEVIVQNLAASGESSTKHWALNEQLMPGSKIYPIKECSTLQHDCPSCQDPQNTLPGCSDSQWP